MIEGTRRRGLKWLGFQFRSLASAAGRLRGLSSGARPTPARRLRSFTYVTIRAFFFVVVLLLLWPFLELAVLTVEDYEHEVSSIRLLQQALRSRGNRQASFEPDTEPADAGGVAFAIQVGGANIHMVPRLLKALYSPYNCFALTLDHTVTDMQRNTLHRALAAEPGVGNTTILMPAVAISFNGISTVLSTIDAMEELLGLSSHWTHFSNLEPYDYPLVSAGQLRRLLSSWKESLLFDIQNDDSFVPKPLKNGTLFGSSRVSLDQEFLVFDGAGGVYEPGQEDSEEISAATLVSGTINPYVYYQQFDTVSADPHMIIPRDFVEFCVSSTFAKQFMLNFANVLHPARHFFPTTALSHSTYSQRVISVPLGAYAAMNLPAADSGGTADDDSVSQSVFWDTGAAGSEEALFKSEGRFFASPLQNTDTRFRHVVDAMTRGTTEPDAMWARWNRSIASATEEARGRPEGKTVGYVDHEKRAMAVAAAAEAAAEAGAAKVAAEVGAAKAGAAMAGAGA